ncbi:HAD-IA family hydrolase [archaeon]|nr:HAD-IA family hydrolase [archaeon]
MNPLDKSNIKAIIFDLDGTLIDSSEIYFKAINHILSKFSISCTMEEMMVHCGAPAEDIYIYFLKEQGVYDPSRKEELKKEFDEKFRELLKDKDIFPEDSKKALIKLKKKGYTFAMGTGATRISTVSMVPKDILLLFDAVVTCDDVTNPKPDPETFLKASEDIMTPPTKCIVIGDGRHDLIAAKEAGMGFILLRNDHNRDFDPDGCCICEINRMIDLTNIL